MRRGTPVVVAVALALAGCNGGDTDGGGATGQPIVGAFADGSALEIEFVGCESDPDVDLVEASDDVRITLAGSTDCEPVHELTIELDAPLGDRTLIDGSTGEEVPVGG